MMFRTTRSTTVVLALAMVLAGLPTVQASGPSVGSGDLLVLRAGEAAPDGFEQLAAAAQMDYHSLDEVPEEGVSAFECVVLPANQAFTEATQAALVSYVQRGGNLLALGEEATADGSANGAMSALAEAMGSMLRLDDNARGSTATTTEEIGWTTLTTAPPGTATVGADVQTIRYDGFTEVEQTARLIAPGLAYSADGDHALLAAQQIGLGILTLAGDIDLFSDANPSAFTDTDNGALGANLCTGDLALGYEDVRSVNEDGVDLREHAFAVCRIAGGGTEHCMRLTEPLEDATVRGDQVIFNLCRIAGGGTEHCYRLAEPFASPVPA